MSEDGSDPSEVRHWQQQQAAEAELAAAEEAVTAGAKVPTVQCCGLAHICPLCSSLCGRFISQICHFSGCVGQRMLEAVFVVAACCRQGTCVV